MFADSLVQEVERLLAAGYTPDLPSFSSLGYREVAGYLTGEHDLEEAKMLLRRHTRQFIRRQYNWFRLSDPNITWFDLEEQEPGDVLAFVLQASILDCWVSWSSRKFAAIPPPAHPHSFPIRRFRHAQ